MSVPKEASELTGESAQARPKSSRLPRSIWFLLVLTLALVFVSLSMYLGPYKSGNHAVFAVSITAGAFVASAVMGVSYFRGIERHRG